LTTPRRLLSNTAVVIAGSAAQRVLTFGLTVLLARGLGSQQFGVYAFVVAYMFIFSFLVDMGFERVISREVARQPERAGQLLGTGFIIRGALSVVAAALAIGIGSLLHLPALTWWCILIAAVGMPLSIEILVRSFFQARFEMHYTYLLTLPGNVAFLILAAVVIRLGGGLLPIFGAGLVVGVMTLTVMLWVALPKIGVVWRVNTDLMRYLWRESWELGVVILIFLVAIRLDQLLLFWLRGPSELAQYAVAVKVAEALNLIPESIMVTVFPLLAATEFSAPQRFRRVYELTIRYLIVLVLPLALLITLERDLVIRSLFGPGYASGSGALAILAWWMFFSYTGAVYLGLMVVRSQQRVIAVVSLLALAINLALNLLWIPRWGAAGAAAANLVSSSVSFGLFCVAPQTGGIMRACWGEAVRPAIAIALTAGVVALLPPNVGVFAAVPLYTAILLLSGGVDRQDWEMARTLWRPARGGS
jgi:O-antigen/teichoic acid export membrane protein